MYRLSLFQTHIYADLLFAPHTGAGRAPAADGASNGARSAPVEKRDAVPCEQERTLVLQPFFRRLRLLLARPSH